MLIKWRDVTDGRRDDGESDRIGRSPLGRLTIEIRHRRPDIVIE